MSAVRDPLDPDVVADRLNSGSVRRSYSPEVAIDWDAPLDPDKYFLPPELISLYGTSYWDELTAEQRIDLSRQEMSNILSVGLWFENVLNRGILHRLLSADHAAPFAHYALTEMGDECRHMTMFGKAIARSGARMYRLRTWERVIAARLPFLLGGAMLWVGALVGEEIFDAWQRQWMNDPDLQPYVSQVMRIHVTEEARHIKFAREGVRYERQRMGRLERAVVANAHGLAALFFGVAFTNPTAYRRAGLDPERSVREARSSRHFGDLKIEGFASLAQFLEENGLMGRFARRMWHRAGYLR
ncbi:MAG: diiron oxygenase [Nocardioidaceae bacterium]|nr:diiron oxygenase [Nocardioidaceae bacterium]